MSVKFLGLADVIELQWRQIREFGGSDGIRNAAMLRSALASARGGSGDQPSDAGVFDVAASYLVNLVRDQPFVDGNKRTGLASAIQFLSLNGKKLTANEDAVLELVQSVAKNETDKGKIADFLRQNSQDR